MKLCLEKYCTLTLFPSRQGIARSLYGSNVLVVGAGGITTALLSQLEPFQPHVTVLRRRADPLDPKDVPAKLKDQIRVGTLADLDNHIGKADVVVLTCALTADTHGCIGKLQLQKMQKHAVIVNVARGEVIRTADLVEALEQGTIGGAGLDVTDPEPLPDNHPLWSLSTSHPALDLPREKGGQRANVIIVSSISIASVAPHSDAPTFRLSLDSPCRKHHGDTSAPL